MLCRRFVLHPEPAALQNPVQTQTSLQSRTRLTGSCPNWSSSAPDSTGTSSGAVATDVSVTQLFDRRPVTPPLKKSSRRGFYSADSLAVTLTRQQHVAQEGDGGRGNAAVWNGRQSDGDAPVNLIFWSGHLPPVSTQNTHKHTHIHTLWLTSFTCVSQTEGTPGKWPQIISRMSFLCRNGFQEMTRVHHLESCSIKPSWLLKL